MKTTNFQKIIPALSVLAFLLPCRAAAGNDTGDTLVSLQPQNRKILIEEFTGLHCPNCPAGHKIANEIQASYPEDCFLINVHAGTLAKPYNGEVDLRSAYGEDLAAQAKVSAIPSVSVNRHIFPGQNGWAITGRNYWTEYAEEILDMTSYVNAGARATVNWENSTLKVEVQLYYSGEAPPSLTQNRIHIALLQNNIEGTQHGAEANPAQVLPNGNYLHGHVLRDLLTGMEGAAVNIPGKGGFLSRSFEKNLPAVYGNVNLDWTQMQVVVFVSEEEGGILTACPAPLTFVNGPEYVFDLHDAENLMQPTCDNTTRVAFKVRPLLTETSESIENITFLCSTPGGLQHKFTRNVAEQASRDVWRIESDAIELDKTGETTEVFLQATAVNGKALSQTQPPIAVTVRKDYYPCSSSALLLDVWQDRWGEETSWTFRDEDGFTVDAVESYPNLNASGTLHHAHHLTMTKGCYRFVLKDRDGINNGSGEGKFRMSDAGGKILVSHQGDFKDSVIWLLQYTPASSQVSSSCLGWYADLQPNPASGHTDLQVDVPRPTTISIRLYQPDGRLLHHYGTRRLDNGKHTLRISLGNYPAGFYLIVLQNPHSGQSQTLKLFNR